ncbi:hypothetical protein ACFQZ4_08740 [Catellatospora coxensis]
MPGLPPPAGQRPDHIRRAPRRRLLRRHVVPQGVDRDQRDVIRPHHRRHPHPHRHTGPLACQQGGDLGVVGVAAVDQEAGEQVAEGVDLGDGVRAPAGREHQVDAGVQAAGEAGGDGAAGGQPFGVVLAGGGAQRAQVAAYAAEVQVRHR